MAIHEYSQSYFQTTGFVTLKVFTAVKINVAMWIVTPFSLVGGRQRFRGLYCFHFQCSSKIFPEGGGIMFIIDVGAHVLNCMASYCIRLQSKLLFI